MYAFTPESIRKLQADHERLRSIVSSIQLPVETPAYIEEDIRYAELDATLEPGGSAAATLMKYDREVADYATGGIAITVHDPHNCNFGITDEVLPVKRLARSGRYEVIGEHGLERRGKADDVISADSSAAVSIWTGSDAGSDSTVNVTAYLRWMHGDEAVSSGKEVLVQYIPDMTQWLVIGAECE